jgi:pimeloyl-ACP methyl ester carboxylesterase
MIGSQPSSPTLVLIPCFSGAPWSADQRQAFAPLAVRALALPDGLDELEEYADAVEAAIADLNDYVLVGDSFGAAVALTLAVRQPCGLSGLVLSGGFASDPLTSVMSRVGSRFAPWMPGPLYRQVVLRFHALLLRSPHDTAPGAEVRWPLRASRRLFLDATPWKSYTGRVRAVRRGDARSRLGRVQVPTLVLAPSYDHLVGEAATAVLSDSIPGAEHVVLDGTGHMFRFTHPRRYARAVIDLLERSGVISAEKAAR